MKEKKCSKCKETKPVSEFHKDRRAKDGLQWECKLCKSAADKKKYQQNKESYITQKKEYQQSFGGRFARIKSEAKRRGIPFKLTKTEAKRFWKQPCHYCNTFDITLNLDRVDSAGIYEIDNVVSCCFDCNTKKGTKSYEDFLLEC